MAIPDEGIELVKYRRELVELANRLGVDGRKGFWRDQGVTVQVLGSDVGGVEVVILSEGTPVAVVTLADLLDFATGTHPPYSD